MGLVILLVALLGLAFPPFAIVILGMMILGVFAKGVVADPQEPIVNVTRKARQRHATKRPQDVIPHRATARQPGNVIDVRCYPALPPLWLTTPMSKSEFLGHFGHDHPRNR